MTNKTLREEFFEYWLKTPDLTSSDACNWWLSKIEEVINDMPDSKTLMTAGSEDRYVEVETYELKQQLRSKYLDK